MASVISIVNARLQRAGRPERLVRDAKGYYYVSGVVVSSMLCVYRLDGDDLQMALDHVAAVLSEQDGVQFVWPVEGK